MTAKGTVFLVGAGPGDPGLITVKGLRCLERAEVVVYDRLVDSGILSRAHPDAELVDVGKVPGRGAERQADINALLVSRAEQGKRVVRLKGGDPFIFGRGGEEAEALYAAGIPFEVVPGVSSAVAAPAYAGIPLTHRGFASSFTVVTGNETPDKEASSISWDHLAVQGGTLVVLMGWKNLARVVETLRRLGMAPETPVALIRWGTQTCQKTVVGTLSDIVDRGSEAGLSPPVVAVFGGVVRLRDSLRWFDSRPLFGKRVLVTRTREQAAALSEALYLRGAKPIELPTIEVRPPRDFAGLDDALRRLDSYDWAVFTSVNAVNAVFDRLSALALDTRAFRNTRVGAIGSATAVSLRERGIAADFVPDDFVSESAVKSLDGQGFEGSRVLLPSADIARQTLAQGLASLGARVDTVVAYRTVEPKGSAREVARVLRQGIDIAAFTSSSTVRNLVKLLHGDLDLLRGVTVACIGPITAATVGELGLKADIVAGVHTIAGLVDALEEHFAEEAPPT